MKTTDEGKLSEILWCCMKLQQLGWGDVFYNLSGHVSKLNVWGYEGGYGEFKPETFNFSGFFRKNESLNEQTGLMPLDVILSKLQLMLINK